MKPRIVLFIAAATVIASYLAIGFCCSAPPWLTEISQHTGGAAGVAALFTGLTGILVGWYLYETHLLRLAAEREYSPFLVLTYDTLPDGTPSNIFIRNLGRGPAVSVEVHGLYLHVDRPFHESYVRTQAPAVSPGAILPIILPVPGGYALPAASLHGQLVTIRYSDPAGRRWEQLLIGDPDLADVFRVEGLPKAVAPRDPRKAK